MAILRTILEVLNAQMTAPKPYGWFHLLFFALAVLGGIGLCAVMKKPDTKQVQHFLLIVSLVAIALELYKQINYTFQVTDGVINARYQWYIFPWQFCSTPMYVGLVAALTKGKVHSLTCSYLASFSLFAGLAVMCYPVTVFVDTIGINIQTMVCHGSMITVGIWLLGTGYVEGGFKTVWKALPVFAVMLGVALILNEWAYRVGIAPAEFFNMFYISPYCEPHLPVYSLVQPLVPFPWCLLLYVFGFTVAACAPVLLVTGIKGLAAATVKRKVQSTV